MTDIAFPDARLAQFEDRLIYEAQPSVSDTEIARIEAQLAGPVPPDLAALWRLCYGGRLDYDLDIHFGAHIDPFSFGELFYPGSRGYRDLDGWIAHERSLLAERLRRADNADLKLEFLPFGGFEYHDRLYVRVGMDDYGAVYAYSRGLPPAWHLQLHEASFTRVADDVRALFRMLYVAHDPLTASADDFPAGLEALKAIDLAREAGKLAASDANRLQALLTGAFADWRSALERGTLSADPRLARLALEHAAEAGDLALLQRLERAGIDLARPLRGGGTVLDFALDHGHIGLANALLDLGLKGGPQTFQCVPDGAGPDLLHRLHQAGAAPNQYAVIAAVRAGRLDNAELLARWFIARDPNNREALRQACDASAAAHEHALIEFAEQVRTL
jgi:hypothetical protein